MFTSKAKLESPLTATKLVSAGPTFPRLPDKAHVLPQSREFMVAVEGMIMEEAQSNEAAQGQAGPSLAAVAGEAQAVQAAAEPSPAQHAMQDKPLPQLPQDGFLERHDSVSTA